MDWPNPQWRQHPEGSASLLLHVNGSGGSDEGELPSFLHHPPSMQRLTKIIQETYCQKSNPDLVRFSAVLRRGSGPIGSLSV